MRIKRNLHNIDIAVRFLIGATLIYVCFVDSNYIGNDIARWLLGMYGVVNLISAGLRSCPIYTLAGISTYRK